jgi:hypothetical protein
LSTLCTLLGIFSFDWADKAKMPEKPIKAWCIKGLGWSYIL